MRVARLDHRRRQRAGFRQRDVVERHAEDGDGRFVLHRVESVSSGGGKVQAWKPLSCKVIRNLLTKSSQNVLSFKGSGIRRFTSYGVRPVK